MKFYCEKYLLMNAITIASRAVASKSAIASLEGLLIEAAENIKVSGYDLKTGITTNFTADITEKGSIVLNARLFGEIVRKLPDDIVKIEINENYMAKIECGMSEFEIIGFSATDYPELPQFEHQDSISLPEKTIKNMISQTNFAVSDNESRPIHTGALFEVEDNVLTIVAVDGYRLALRREVLENTANKKFSFVVPGAALNEVEKITGDNNDSATIALGSKHIVFTIKDTVLISRRLEGEFLNYKNSIPQTSKYTVNVEKRAIVDSVDRVSLIINDKLKSPVRCIFGTNILKMSAVTAIGRANDECVTKGDGEELEIGFNNRYLLEALKAAPAEDICIQLTSGISPCIITPTDNGRNFLYMILPVRLKANES